MIVESTTIYKSTILRGALLHNKDKSSRHHHVDDEIEMNVAVGLV